MKTYSTVEEYLEVLGGYRDLSTGKVDSSWFYDFKPIISLARYDVSVLSSMLESVVQGNPLTERQGELLCKILLKYQRQFIAKSVDVTPIEKPTWRTTLRKMDYTKSVTIENTVISVKFPFDTKLIDSIKSFKTTSQGSCLFDRDSKKWKIGLTEYNLVWLHTWASANNFEIDPTVEELNNLILAAEKIAYPIELVHTDDKLDIVNCPPSMREYILNELGGFDHSNLLNLLDYSGILGYTIEPELANVVVEFYGPRTLQLAKNKELIVNPETKTVDDDFVSVLEYAIKVNRLPVVIYEPDMQNRLLTKLATLYPESDFTTIGNSKKPVIDLTKKFIHCTAPIKNMNRIPMLISSAGMVFGGDKQFMLQSAEKIVYVAAEVYNTNNASNNKTRKIEKLINAS
jgi:hypothetical protein